MEKRIAVILDHLEKDLRSHASLKKIAPLVNLSESRLRHIFKEETGMSLKQYQKRLRMVKAKELLEDSFLSVKEIMIKTGHIDRNHFTRSFRDIFGTTPTQHRRRAAAQNQTEQPKMLSAAAGSKC